MEKENSKHHIKIEVKKDTKLKPYKRPSQEYKDFFPENPITRREFIEEIKSVEDNQKFNLKNKKEVIFVLETYPKTSFNDIEKIIDKIDGELVLFLSKTEILIRCKEKNIEKLIRHFSEKKELYKYFKRAVKDVRPLEIEEKISETLSKDFKGEKKNIAFSGLLIPGFDEDEYEELINKLKDMYPDMNVEGSSFTSPSILSFQALGDEKSIKKVAGQPFIYLLSDLPEIELHKIENDEKITFNETSKKKLNDNGKIHKPEICILDSGIDKSALGKIVSTIDGDPSLKGNHNPWDSHGTEVSSIAAFGDELVFNSQIPKNNDANIISYTIPQVDMNLIYSSVLDAVKKYRNRTRIFNLSAGFGKNDARRGKLTNAIDEFLQNQNIILVNSSGNITLRQIANMLSRGNNYPHYLRKFSCVNPSMGKNVFSVSSYAYKDNKNSMCKCGQISPYSALGIHPYISDDRIKPDIFALGGNIELVNSTLNNNKNIAVPTITTNGEISELNGTSYSAPYVAHILALLDHIYSPQNVETLKAILLSYCEVDGDYFKLFDKKNEICFSHENKNIVMYTEGSMGLRRKVSKLRKYRYPRHSIRFYVPNGVKEIRIFLVHSDNSSQIDYWENNTTLRVEIGKPGRQSLLRKPDAENWHFNKSSQIQFAIFDYKRGQTGDWYINIEPEHENIRPSEMDKITIRYGLAINLIFKGQQKITSHPYETIGEKLKM